MGLAVIFDLALENGALSHCMVSDQRCVKSLTIALIHRELVCLVLSSSLYPRDEQSDRDIERKVVKKGVKDKCQVVTLHFYFEG